MVRSRYATAKQEYVQAPDRISVCSLAIKWKIPPRGLRKRCFLEKWVEARHDFQTRLSQRVEEKAIEDGSSAFVDDLKQEMADLKAVRAHILRRLLPDDDYGAPVGKPKDYAQLTNAFIAVDKQMCLRRGVGNLADVSGSLLVRIMPLDGTKPEGAEEEER